MNPFLRKYFFKWLVQSLCVQLDPLTELVKENLFHIVHVLSSSTNSNCREVQVCDGLGGGLQGGDHLVVLPGGVGGVDHPHRKTQGPKHDDQPQGLVKLSKVSVKDVADSVDSGAVGILLSIFSQLGFPLHFAQL